MSRPARVLEILRALANDPTAWGEGKPLDIGHGEILELSGRNLVHEPGFDGWFEPTPAGRALLDGSAFVTDAGSFHTWPK